MTEQTPAHDAHAEQVILGKLMTREDTYDTIAAALHTRDFHHPAHQAIYDTIGSLAFNEKPFDPIAVAAELATDTTLAEAGGRPYLQEILEAALGAEHDLTHYIQALTSLAALREPGYLLAELMPRALDEIEAIGSRDTHPIGIPTGFRDLDVILGGLRPGMLHVLFGAPGIGTSTLALDIVRSAAIAHGHPTLIFSGQSPRNDLIERMLSAEARVANYAMRSGTMQDEDWTRLARRMAEVSDAPLLIDDHPGHSTSKIREKCLTAKDTHGLRLVVIDGVNLYAQPTEPDTLWAAQARVSADIKRLACELRIPIVVTAPINRAINNRVDRRPMLTDIASSSAYEADADVVIGVHREDAYEKESPRAGETDLLILKHRHGPTATITVAFQGHYNRHVDMVSDPSEKKATTEPKAAFDLLDMFKQPAKDDES